MRYMLYNPETQMRYVSEHDFPAQRLNKLRILCYKILNTDTRPSRLPKSIIENGGLGKLKFIMSDSIPYLPHLNYDFVSYANNKEEIEWINNHPGKNIIPLTSYEAYEKALHNRYQWDDLPDMYPTK